MVLTMTMQFVAGKHAEQTNANATVNRIIIALHCMQMKIFSSQWKHSCLKNHKRKPFWQLNYNDLVSWLHYWQRPHMHKKITAMRQAISQLK